MSLVFINNSAETFTPTQSGAIATFIWECWRSAKNQRVEPIVVTRNSTAAIYDSINTLVVDYPRLPNNRAMIKIFRAERRLTGWTHLRQQAYAARVARALQAARVAHLPLFLNNDVELAIYLRRRFPQAFIVHHFHNQLECSEKMRHQVAASLNQATAVSNFTARWVERYYNLPTDSVKTISNGVDLNRFTPALQAPDGPPILNFTGRTGIEKAPDLMLSAALELAEKTQNFSLQILGSNHWDRFEMDEYQGRLAVLVTQLEARNIHVRRPGHISRNALPNELRRAHIHIVPSRWDEPFGLVTLEGMACGLATIASRTGGTPEVVGSSGFLFERNAVGELSDNLYALITNDKLRVEYGRKARLRAEQFSWDRTWDGIRRTAGI